MAEDFDDTFYTDKPLSEAYRLTARRWVDAHAAAQLLEETKSQVLQSWAQELVKNEMITGAEAERRVKASDPWRKHIEAMVEARTRELKLKCNLEYIRMRAAEAASYEASRRAEMRL